ncbi:U4/U6.U5 tri-snRNP-associated protein 2 [Manacus vitellinus]|nr:U4/U6.U5 tri-snRNP-associated protein 2 [Manacus vitellinus]
MTDPLWGDPTPVVSPVPAGRGLKSHAYIHSVQLSHHVFLNLHTLKFYCLPDNYEIIDSSLEDITYVLKPTFTAQHIAHLDKQAKLSRAYDGTTYLPGIVGLNNIKANDYANAVLQALSNVPPLRNYFLEEENYRRIQRPPGDIMFLLVQRFGELMRKLWNPRNFKAHVSPHEMLQAVVLCSKKNFQITKQGDGVEFLSWFLNALHAALGGTKRKKKSEKGVWALRRGLEASGEGGVCASGGGLEASGGVCGGSPAPLRARGVPRNVDLREYLSEEVQAAHAHTTYDLIANIVHDGKPSEGSYRIHVLHHGTGKWYELQDLQVTDILPQMITLSEAYIQIWKRREEDETNQQGA